MLAVYQLSVSSLLSEALIRTLQVSLFCFLFVGAFIYNKNQESTLDVAKILAAAISVHIYRWIVDEWNALDDSLFQEKYGVDPPKSQNEEESDELHDQRLMSFAVYASGKPFAKIQTEQDGEAADEKVEEEEENEQEPATTAVTARRRSSYNTREQLLQKQDSAVWRTVLATGATFNKVAAPRRSFVALESSRS